MTVHPECKTKHATHLRCAELKHNTAADVGCPVCPTDPQAVLKIFTDWSGITTAPPKVARAQFESANPVGTNVATALQSGMEVDAIVSAYDKRKCDLPASQAFASVGRYAAHDMVYYCEEDMQTPVHSRPGASVSTLVSSYPAPGDVAQSIGMTLPMFMHTSADRAALLNRSRFDPKTLSAPNPFGLSAHRLFLSGISPTRFAEARYNHEDLAAMNFSIKGFIAAGATASDIAKLISSSPSLPTELRTRFGYTKAMETLVTKLVSNT